MHTRHAVLPALAAPLAAAALLAAGCGSGSPSRAVADVGSAGGGTTTQGGPAAPSSTASSGSAGGGGPGLTMKTANGAKFAACMRSHGVPRFPDPSAHGGAIQFGPGSGIDPESPKFKAAQKACQKLLPNGGQPTPQEQARMQQQALAFSACMRKHGVPSFPDPTFSDGGMRITLNGGRGSGLDPKSPKFQAAQKACQGTLPGARAGGASAGK